MKINSIPEMTMSKCSTTLLIMAKFGRFRRIAFEIALRLERGPFFSLTAREILSKNYGVEVGAYSYGQCMIPGAFPPGVKVGRYVSMANNIRIFNRNHPGKWLSMHPFFFNSRLGIVNKDPIRFGSCKIGHDAWIGEGVKITAGCTQIGIGATIGTGSIVTRNIPDFAVAVGAPARVVKFRFTPEICTLILNSKWWNKSISECSLYLEDMQRDIEVSPTLHPFLRS